MLDRYLTTIGLGLCLMACSDADPAFQSSDEDLGTINVDMVASETDSASPAITDAFFDADAPVLTDGGALDMAEMNLDTSLRADGAVDSGLLSDGGMPDIMLPPLADTGVDGEVLPPSDATVVDMTPIDICDDLEASYVTQAAPPAEPPYWGTLFVDDEIIVDSDPTSFRGLTYGGQAERTMFDRRTGTFGRFQPHLFIAQFGQDKQVEVQVNPEMSREEGEAEARRYCRVIGQIPGFLFRDLDTVWLHRGLNAFGGGNRNLLIHTGQGAQYIRDGLLGEVFLHEAAHTSLDAYHQDDPLWLAAQNADGQAISQYAADFPRREDIAETLPLYLTVRFWSDRVDQSLVDTVLRTIPNRLRYFDCQNFSTDILP